MMQDTEKPKITNLFKDSIVVKISVITILILVLLIPSAWVQSLIEERSQTQDAVRNDISNKWSGNQSVQGPVLVIPYKKLIKSTDVHRQETITTEIEYAYILPENLNIKADAKTELFHQGVIDATEYTSKIAITGNFAKPNFAQLGIDPALVLYDKAKVVFGISDLKGLKSNPVLNIDGHPFNPEPAYGDNTVYNKGLQAAFILTKDAGFSFSYNLDLKGTDELTFLHLGKTTDVEVISDWKSPVFIGRNLPDSHKTDETGFKAKWRLLYFNRTFPQQWANQDTLLSSKVSTQGATFGVKFSLPVDQYRKTMRTTRYSSLIILLTFVSLLLTELIRKQSVHLFNYILIGAAMVVYYTLLLAFAEHVGYDIAYLISSVSTITLISWFLASLLGNKPVALLFGLILTTFYGFVYVLIQLEELSLLIGSCALFIIVALLMYFSRKINWEKH